MKSTFGHKLALFKFDTVLNYFYFVPFPVGKVITYRK